MFDKINSKTDRQDQDKQLEKLLLEQKQLRERLKGVRERLDAVGEQTPEPPKAPEGPDAPKAP